MPYEQFLAERRAIVEARQRAQQRFDQLVTGGAAGALVLSITFLDRFSAGPPRLVPALLIAWTALLISLLCTLASHYFSQQAFDCFLQDFDEAYAAGTLCDPNNRPARISQRLALGGASLFLVGVAFMAAFAYANLPLTRTTNSHEPGTAATQSVAAPGSLDTPPAPAAAAVEGTAPSRTGRRDSMASTSSTGAHSEGLKPPGEAHP